MATYVLVHGGGHGGWCWQRLAPLLRAAGHEVYTPTLTGLGERAHLLSPAVSLDTHITDIVKVLEYEDLREVILVGHSYGGMVITGVADRAAARLGWLVFLDAVIPASGESLADASPGIEAFAELDRRTVDGTDLVLWPGPIAQAVYGVTGADWAWMAPKLTPHPWRTFTDRLVLANEAALAHIPRAIVNCRHTLGLRPEAQRQRYAQAEQVWEIDAAHDLMVTEPRALAGWLLTLA